MSLTRISHMCDEELELIYIKKSSRVNRFVLIESNLRVGRFCKLLLTQTMQVKLQVLSFAKTKNVF